MTAYQIYFKKKVQGVVRKKGSDRTITTLLYQKKCHIKARLGSFFQGSKL